MSDRLSINDLVECNDLILHAIIYELKKIDYLSDVFSKIYSKVMSYYIVCNTIIIIDSIQLYFITIKTKISLKVKVIDNVRESSIRQCTFVNLFMYIRII